ncbi:MAG: shikimate dehydrogenase [Bacteroidaceae bacterium]|jgi:shikimate dehydrogenase|nr:shikimate dehydrogenase [Bacteroidaceae bacterium]
MEQYGLIGYPLGHSFSRRFFNEEFFPEHGIEAEYLNFEIPEADGLLEVVRTHPLLRGLNCTIPHKQAIIPLLDEISPEAREIGAVNVIRIRDGRLKGFNSDIIGFMDSLRPLLRPHHRRALVLGSGGASKAVWAGLLRLGLEPMQVSRKAGDGVLSYEMLTPEVMADCTVVVNCSPVGMFPHVDECPAIPYELLSGRHLLYDLVYNPLDTLFMQRGRERGATVKNGLEMLRLQALASWKFWHSEL